MRTKAYIRQAVAAAVMAVSSTGVCLQAHSLPPAPTSARPATMAPAVVGSVPKAPIGVPDFALAAASFSPAQFDDWATCTYLAAVVHGTVIASQSHHLPDSVIEYTNYDITVHSSSSDAVTAGTTITVGVGSAVSVAANLDELHIGDDILLFLGEDRMDTDAYAGATYYPVGAAGIYHSVPGVKLGGESMYLRRDHDAHNVVNLLILNETKLNRMLTATGHKPLMIP